MDHQQRLFDIIAILTDKLGGEVTITERELQRAPTGKVTRNPDGSMVLSTERHDKPKPTNQP